MSNILLHHNARACVAQHKSILEPRLPTRRVVWRSQRKAPWRQFGNGWCGASIVYSRTSTRPQILLGTPSQEQAKPFCRTVIFASCMRFKGTTNSFKTNLDFHTKHMLTPSRHAGIVMRTSPRIIGTTFARMRPGGDLPAKIRPQIILLQKSLV